MRCPKCRKTVHPDDIYCVWCSASLRGKSPGDPWNCICADEDTHRTHTPRRPIRRSSGRKPGKAVVFILVLTLVLTFLPGILAGIIFSLDALVDEVHTLAVAPEPEPVVPEDAWMLDTVMARWEGFTVTADYISMDEITGELELIYTAENQTDHTIITADASITAEGYTLPQMLYIQLEPGETQTHYFWIDTAALQAVNISRLQALTVSLSLMEEENYTLLAVTDPVTLTVDFDLPPVSMHKGSTTLIETADLTVTLVGWQTEPDYGEMTLYTLIENRSAEQGTIFMEEARCNETDLHLYGYYDAPPGTKLLCWDMLYDIPFSQTGPSEITFSSRIQDAMFDTTATGETVIRLDPGGSSGSIRSEWE